MKRIIELDIYKAAAAVMVILIHVTATPVVTLGAGISAEVLVAVNRFAKPSVPMFIFASGVSLCYVYRNGEFRYMEFLKKRIMKILLPYLFWCAIYYGYYVMNGAYEASPMDFLAGAVSGKMIYHLYFVVIIIQFYLLFGFFRSVSERLRPLNALPAAIIINMLAIQYLPAEYMGRCFLTYLTYYLMGCYLGKYLEEAVLFIKKYQLLFGAAFIGTGALYAFQFYEAQVLGIGYRFLPDAYAFLIFSAIACIFYYICAGAVCRATGGGRPQEKPSALGRLLIAISDGSYYIYLSHPLAIIAAESLSARLGVTGVIDRMLVALAVIFATAVPLSILYARTMAAWRRRRAKS